MLSWVLLMLEEKLKKTAEAFFDLYYITHINICQHISLYFANLFHNNCYSSYDLPKSIRMKLRLPYSTQMIYTSAPSTIYKNFWYWLTIHVIFTQHYISHEIFSYQLFLRVPIRQLENSLIRVIIFDRIQWLFQNISEPSHCNLR